MIEILPHTADVRVRISAGSLAELFSEAMKAMFIVLAPGEPEGPEVHLRFEVDSSDRTTLLVDLLNEILVAALTRKEAYDALSVEFRGATTLSATARGRGVRAFGDDVKAVTYHEAEVREEGGTWSSLLVFDV